MVAIGCLLDVLPRGKCVLALLSLGEVGLIDVASESLVAGKYGPLLTVR